MNLDHNKSLELMTAIACTAARDLATAYKKNDINKIKENCSFFLGSAFYEAFGISGQAIIDRIRKNPDNVDFTSKLNYKGER